MAKRLEGPQATPAHAPRIAPSPDVPVIPDSILSGWPFWLHGKSWAHEQVWADFRPNLDSGPEKHPKPRVSRRSKTVPTAAHAEGADPVSSLDRLLRATVGRLTL